MGRVIIDTDFVTDPGDLGAHVLAAVCHRLGFIEIVGSITNTSHPKTPGAIDATLRWYGVTLPTTSFGAWKGASIDAASPSGYDYVGAVYDNYSHSIGLASSVDDSTTVYRRLLAAATQRVDIIGLGYNGALAALIQSSADAISSLTGVELISEKVGTLYSMCGAFPDGAAEWNAKGGSTARSDMCTASNVVATQFPRPIIYVGYEAGLATPFCGGTYGRNYSSDLQALAYSIWAQDGGNYPWDQIPIWAAASKCAGVSLVRGSATFNTSTGVATWTNDQWGEDAYVVVDDPIAVAACINALEGADRSSLLSAWDGVGMVAIR